MGNENNIIDKILKKPELNELIKSINSISGAGIHIVSFTGRMHKNRKNEPEILTDKNFIESLRNTETGSEEIGVKTIDYKKQSFFIYVVKEIKEPIAAILTPDYGQTKKKYIAGTLKSIGQLLLKLYVEEKENDMNLRRMSALYKIGTSLSSSMDKQKTLKMVINYAKSLLGAQNCSLMLLNQDTGDLKIVMAYGLSRSIIANSVLKLGQGIAGKTALYGKPILLKKGYKASGSHIESKAEEIPSAISVPIKLHDKVIGVINVSKSIDENDFTEAHQELLVMFANQAAVALENSRLMEELQELFVQSITALANAIDARDRYTKGHSQRVTIYSMEIAKRLSIRKEELDMLQYAALLHDIGKINIRDSILNKPEKLSDEEYSEMKKHPEYGAKIMEPVKRFSKLLPYMYHHHEKFAGEGYPYHLKGEEIPLIARIITVADSFDAMTSDRPYRKGRSIEYALDELKNCSGSQFDPDVVEVFCRFIQEKGKEFVKKLIKRTSFL